MSVRVCVCVVRPCHLRAPALLAQVEVWDVVDRAHRRPKPGQLKIALTGDALDEAEAKAGAACV